MTSGERLGNNPTYYVWQAPSDVLSIHLSLKVVADLTREHLRAIAQGLPWEFRGVLLGHSVEEPEPATFIEDFALIPNSEADKNVATATDDELAEIACRLHRGLDFGRNAVGFFRSQSEGALIPSTRDLKVANRLFSEPDNVMMLLRFSPCGESQAAFFYRDKGKLQRPAPSYSFPFDVAHLSTRKAARRPADRFGRDWPRIASDVRNAPPSSGRIRWWQLLPTAAVFTLGTIAAQTGFTLHHPGTPAAAVSTAESALGLKAVPSQQHLDIRWNRDSKAIRNAQSAELWISEGDVVRAEPLPMSKQQLQRGNMIYTPLTGDVSIRLDVKASDGTITTESIRSN